MKFAVFIDDGFNTVAMNILHDGLMTVAAGELSVTSPSYFTVKRGSNL
jgi:hypothetical protein